MTHPLVLTPVWTLPVDAPSIGESVAAGTVVAGLQPLGNQNQLLSQSLFGGADASGTVTSQLTASSGIFFEEQRGTVPVGFVEAQFVLEARDNADQLFMQVFSSSLADTRTTSLTMDANTGMSFVVSDGASGQSTTVNLTPRGLIVLGDAVVTGSVGAPSPDSYTFPLLNITRCQPLVPVSIESGGFTATDTVEFAITGSNYPMAYFGGAGTQKRITFELTELIDKSLLQFITLDLVVQDPHVGGVPANFPSFDVWRIPILRAPNVLPDSLSNTVGVAFPNPGSGAAWQNSGFQQSLTMTPTRDNLIDRIHFRYVMVITDEWGANATSGDIIVGVTLQMNNIGTLHIK